MPDSAPQDAGDGLSATDPRFRAEVDRIARLIDPDAFRTGPGVARGHRGRRGARLAARKLAESSLTIAAAFHRAYEDVAPANGYETREESRVPFDQLPEANRETMLATVRRLLELDVIAVGGRQRR